MLHTVDEEEEGEEETGAQISSSRLVDRWISTRGNILRPRKRKVARGYLLRLYSAGGYDQL